MTTPQNKPIPAQEDTDISAKLVMIGQSIMEAIAHVAPGWNMIGSGFLVDGEGHAYPFVVQPVQIPEQIGLVDEFKIINIPMSEHEI